MPEFGEIVRLPEPDKLLTSLGYSLTDYRFNLIGIDDYTGSERQIECNRNSVSAPTLDGLITELEENSCIEARYISQGHEEELREKFSDVIEKYAATGFQSFPHETANSLKNMVEHKMESKDPESIPARVSIPHKLEVDFSNLEKYQSLIEKIEYGGYEVDEISLNSGHPDYGKDLDELENSLNQAVLEIKTENANIRYFNMPEGNFFDVAPSEESIEDILNQEF